MGSTKSLQLILITLILLVLNVPTSNAEQDTVLRFSPILIIDSTQTLSGKKLLIMEPNLVSSMFQLPTDTDNKLSTGDLDDYSISLGATLHINENLNIGAACGLLFVSEEPIQVEDLSIAAMVTMQF